MPVDRFLHPRCGKSDKVTGLTDFEFRVWTQYILSADDFGVMRHSAVSLQAQNDALAAKKPPVVQKAFEHLVKVGLLRTFMHQQRRYVFQSDWQVYQKIEWPRSTIEPKPDDDTLGSCSESTRKLFDRHPGGKAKAKPKDLGSIPQMDPEDLESTSQMDPKAEQSGCASVFPAKAKANGLRLTANGSDEAAKPPDVRAAIPFDVWFLAFQQAYPPKGRTAGPLAMQAFLAAFDRDPRPAADVWAQIEASVKGYAQSDSVRSGKVKNMTAWLAGGHYAQVHSDPDPEHPRLSANQARYQDMAREAGAAMQRGSK